MAPTISPACPLQFSDDFDRDGADLFAAADRMGLARIVSKRADSRYPGGRPRAWLKCKCMTESELIVVGDRGRRRQGALCASRKAGGGRYLFAGQAIIALRH